MVRKYKQKKKKEKKRKEKIRKEKKKRKNLEQNRTRKIEEKTPKDMDVNFEFLESTFLRHDFKPMALPLEAKEIILSRGRKTRRSRGDM